MGRKGDGKKPKNVRNIVMENKNKAKLQPIKKNQHQVLADVASERRLAEKRNRKIARKKRKNTRKTCNTTNTKLHRPKNLQPTLFKKRWRNKHNFNYSMNLKMKMWIKKKIMVELMTVVMVL